MISQIHSLDIGLEAFRIFHSLHHVLHCIFFCVRYQIIRLIFLFDFPCSFSLEFSCHFSFAFFNMAIFEFFDVYYRFLQFSLSKWIASYLFPVQSILSKTLQEKLSLGKLFTLLLKFPLEIEISLYFVNLKR